MKLVAKIQEEAGRCFVFFQMTGQTDEDRTILKHFGVPNIGFGQTNGWKNLAIWDGEWHIVSFDSAEAARRHVAEVGAAFKKTIHDLYARWEKEKESGTSFEFVP